MSIVPYICISVASENMRSMQLSAVAKQCCVAEAGVARVVDIAKKRFASVLAKLAGAGGGRRGASVAARRRRGGTSLCGKA